MPARRKPRLPPGLEAPSVQESVQVPESGKGGSGAGAGAQAGGREVQERPCMDLVPAAWPFALRSKAAADAFRHHAYRRARLPPQDTTQLPTVPRQITIVSAFSGEEVTNKARSAKAAERAHAHPGRSPAPL
jgi:hypothetical protein